MIDRRMSNQLGMPSGGRGKSGPEPASLRCRDFAGAGTFMVTMPPFGSNSDAFRGTSPRIPQDLPRRPASDGDHMGINCARNKESLMWLFSSLELARFTPCRFTWPCKPRHDQAEPALANGAARDQAWKLS